MSKTDKNYAAILGGISALFAVPIFLNLGFAGIFGNSILIAFAAAGFFIALVVGAPFGLRVFHWAAQQWGEVIFEIGKYGLVGVANTAIHVGIINALIALTGIASGLWTDVFFIAAFVMGVTNGFLWNKFWTFGARTLRARMEYIKYFGITGAMFLAGVFLYHFFVSTIGAPPDIDPKIWANIVLGILIPAAFLGNFLGTKFFVFQPRRDVVPPAH